ncbi:hypothetical protein E4U59_001777 [Claviceps monticola]|nr:hypothetical protein E4U59_001777 [Claviceps monticola]
MKNSKPPLPSRRHCLALLLRKFVPVFCQGTPPGTLVLRKPSPGRERRDLGSPLPFNVHHRRKWIRQCWYLGHVDPAFITGRTIEQIFEYTYTPLETAGKLDDCNTHHRLSRDPWSGHCGDVPKSWQYPWQPVVWIAGGRFFVTKPAIRITFFQCVNGLWLDVNGYAMLKCYRQPRLDTVLDYITTLKPPTGCLIEGVLNAKARPFRPILQQSTDERWPPRDLVRAGLRL